MAFDPSTVNSSNAPIGAAETDSAQRVVSAGPHVPSNFRQGLDPDFRPPIGLRPNADALYSIKFAGYRPEADGKTLWGQEKPGHSEHLYGDYWDASLEIFSIAAFEAQQFVQMSLNEADVRVTPQQGNEAYIATKNVLQMATVTQTKVDDGVEVNEANLRINLKA